MCVMSAQVNHDSVCAQGIAEYPLLAPCLHFSLFYSAEADLT